MSIANDFELPKFISRPLELMGWAKHFYDGTDFIHPNMVRFAYKFQMAEVVDELRAGHYVIKFDVDTINTELGLDTNINFPGEVLLLNRNEKDLQNALVELCVDDARCVSLQQD